ncbi:hypothetical protein GCM10009717_07620 [Agromyces allii]|uniref:Uncharacterized protein n=1 Tax=Agromyces allii TaxID=393607 RepID=A0ABN2Q3V5_9MICO
MRRAMFSEERSSGGTPKARRLRRIDGIITMLAGTGLGGLGEEPVQPRSDFARRERDSATDSRVRELGGAVGPHSGDE